MPQDNETAELGHGSPAESRDSEADLGSNLRAARKRRGLSQQELADQSGVSQGVVSMIERGAVRSPGIELVTKLEDALSVARGSLYTERIREHIDLRPQKTESARLGTGRPRRRRPQQPTALAINLDRIRFKYRLSLAQLVEITGVSRIPMIVSGHDRNTRHSTVERIAEGVSKHVGKKITAEWLLRPSKDLQQIKHAEEKLRSFLASPEAAEVKTEEIPKLREFPWPYEPPDTAQTWLYALYIIRDTDPESDSEGAH